MKVLLFLDYDGTLTPIVSHPKLAVLTPKRRRLLRQLASSSNFKVVIISGRKLSELKKLVRISGVAYVGNHGLEMEINGQYFVLPKAKRYIPVLRKIRRALTKKIRLKGIVLEDKVLTLSLHYRLLKKQFLPLFQKLFSEVIAPWQSGINLVFGKKVIEIRPKLNWDKGKAVKWIMRKFKFQDFYPIYLGDDQTDEDAFLVLKGLTVRVGKSLKTSARYFVKDVNAVYAFLKFLLDSLGKS